MTMHLIELLTSLVIRPSVREIVRMGILPLITTVSSYMICTKDLENQFNVDHNLFIYQKEDDVYKSRTIRNCCVDLVSKLIEDF